MDTYFAPATEEDDVVVVLHDKDIIDAGAFYMNFKGFLFQGEFYDGMEAYAHLPEGMLVTGQPVVTFDSHTNIA